MAAVGFFDLHTECFSRILDLFQETYRRYVGVDIDESLRGFLGHGSSDMTSVRA
jgi:hypothetical protein